MTPALLVIDVQRLLCEGRWACHEADEVVARIAALVRRARAAGAPVVWIQHADLTPGSPMAQGSEGWQLAAGLPAPLAGELHIHKHVGDAFHATSLEAGLRALGVDTLVVTGMQSDFCVDSTVRRALVLGFDVQLVADGHTTLANGVLAAPLIRAHHTATLTAMDSGPGRAVSVAAAHVAFG